MAKSGTLTVRVLGDAKPFEKTMGKIGKTAAVAFAAVGTAAVAGAVKSVMAFTDFQGQMNEVFTLLPGISQDAMDDMTGQVKNFSKEFGVLPDEVVPALYQSLSAGVPKDNVFEFLETAQMAAKGGVTELTTAVDGISSVVNAYGSDVVNATQASDLMFTAVRLGKTNFEELSASLSNVTPIASGLGVKFEDVSAAMAAMTAKGTPTAQATTQLRSMFVELSKAGGKTAGVFEDIAGKTFQEFIASGGDTSEALWLMQKAADESGVQLQDLFGSVEAGAAALSLAGGDTFANNLEEMGNAAGATEDAFDQMMTGLGPIFDRIKANIAVFLIDVGEKLAPVVEKGLALAGKAFSNLSKQVAPLIATFKEFWYTLTSGFTQDEGTDVEMWALKARDALETLGDIMRTKIVPAVETVGRFLKDRLIPGLVDLGRWVVEHKPVLIGISVAIGVGLTAAFVSWAVAAAAAAAATIAATAPVIAIGAAIAALTAGIVWAYQNWDFFRESVDAVATFLTGTVWPAIQTGVSWLNDKLAPAIQSVASWFTGTFVPAVASVVSWLNDKLAPIFRRNVELMTGTVIPAIQAVARFFTGTLIPAVAAVIEWHARMAGRVREVVTDIRERIGGLVAFFRGLPGRIANAASHMFDFLITAARNAADAVLRQIDRMLGPIDEVAGKLGGLADKAGGLIGKIPGFAHGVTNFSGGLAVVGERGPELVHLPRGSSVTPNHRLSSSTPAASTGRSDEQLVALFVTALERVAVNVSVSEAATGIRRYERALR